MHLAATLRSPKQMIEGLGRSGRLGLSGVLGAASAFSFAPYYLWPIMLISLCGLVWLIDTSTGARDAAACGWFFGVGHFASGLYWISISFQFQANMPFWLGWIAVVGLAAYLALYPALALWIASRFWSTSSARILVFAASWATTEWLRGHLLTGFPWNAVAQIWSESPIAMQSARLYGAYGLSLVTVTLFASVALLQRKSARSHQMLLLAAFFALVVLADGWRRLAAPQNAPQKPLRVHLVQANIRQDLETDPERQREILRLYQRMTAAALQQRGPALVVWPETALEYDVEGDPALRSQLAQTIGKDGLLVLGAVGQRYAPDGAWRGSRNSLLVLNGSGTLEAVYDKVQLVPFGEYLPAGDILSRLGLVSVAGGSARFLAGKGPATLAVPGVAPFSPLICYEVIFSGDFVDRSGRPAWLLNISNDAWFGHSSGPHQHLAQARIRAVEEGLPVVRSTPTGISAVIDAYGRLQGRTALGQRMVLTAAVPSTLSPTPYALLGDRVFLAMLSAWFALGGWLTRSSRRRKISEASAAGNR